MQIGRACLLLALLSLGASAAAAAGWRECGAGGAVAVQAARAQPESVVAGSPIQFLLDVVSGERRRCCQAGSGSLSLHICTLNPTHSALLSTQPCPCRRRRGLWHPQRGGALSRRASLLPPRRPVPGGGLPAGPGPVNAHLLPGDAL